MSSSSERDADETGGALSRRNEARCGGCGQSAMRTRRGLCAACYARWVRARPVGLGASCASCADRRLPYLRHFELRGLWVVLCHNCCARAERLTPAPRSVDVLLDGIQRQRRSGLARIDRRTDRRELFEAAALERRRLALRQAEERLEAEASDELDDAPFELVIEIVDDVAPAGEVRGPDGEPITAVHSPLDPSLQ